MHVRITFGTQIVNNSYGNATLAMCCAKLFPKFFYLSSKRIIYIRGTEKNFNNLFIDDSYLNYFFKTKK